MPDEDRYVGSAPVPTPTPTTAIPYTEPIVGAARPRRSMLMVAGFAAGGFIILLVGVLLGLVMRFGSTAADPPPAAPVVPPPTTSSPAAKPDSPRQTTERFLTAVVAGDQTAAQERLCGLLKSGQGTPGPELNWLKGLVGYKIGEERVTGPTASVDVELTIPFAGAVNFDVYLLQESGGWRVCGAGPG